MSPFFRDINSVLTPMFHIAEPENPLSDECPSFSDKYVFRAKVLELLGVTVRIKGPRISRLTTTHLSLLRHSVLSALVDNASP